MATNDTIADMLTRIRNANLARHQTTQVPSTKMTRNIAKVLREEGYIGDYEDVGEGSKRNLVISLKYKGKNRQPIITTLKRVSKPGLRVYSNKKELPRVLGGIGIAIISTSSGIMTDREARRQNLGGEVLCYVW
ncbi:MULTISPECIES: 30S ribosomal protein S8 [Fischerella]|jgi:small subunit ribosomal protein S8|uniref:Small ribosomal subunit protein uS8 n=6 Tax=Fischerella TaxID=1190 RepID=G6FQP0_9CYAN|nr:MULTISPECIES: 30S ribosomal protein S8 [Fischerella]PLZ98203.1 30S ribosomal protein S8 [Fischerella thermalis CCMEE 5196]PMB04046.1 30S ribosomal protein S8 [Fischerella thermalis CCMEE 5328]PMB11481.1 30S ribosomal protein S8 [Fischerella thermalis CCMEE 5273]PMB39935.1 30S ribosomal protein S8 [Fischerella thermalis CCMEE 5319]PMB40644.1 30S ribosomal protein S8 [Fischerella thermalis CCMEE 5205]PMB51433.1 30S ribosomal protein S8 [Fischerella thermalis CCMEE 5201]BCX07378.1 MAG: 30S r